MTMRKRESELIDFLYSSRELTRTRKMAEGAEVSSLPVLAVTAAVGAVVLLLVLLCGLGKKAPNEEDNTGGNSTAM